MSKKTQTLPTDSAERKTYPILSGCIRYFPAALAGVANISKQGNDKHNPGQPLHHARGKSTDHGDCILRHLMDVQDLLSGLERGNSDITPEMVLVEVSQFAWRALAYSQELHENLGGAPMAPGAKVGVNNIKTMQNSIVDLNNSFGDNKVLSTSDQEFLQKVTQELIYTQNPAKSLKKNRVNNENDSI